MYLTALDPPVQQPQTTDMSTQPGPEPDQHEDGFGQSMEDTEGVVSCSELNSLRVNKLNQTGVTPMKGTTTQGIKETLTEASEIGFQAANTAKTGTLFCFLETALMDMIH